MNNEIISLRINKELKERMRRQDEVNWSSIIRKAIIKRLEEREEDNFDTEKARKASAEMNKIRKSGIFNKGKTGTEIIREWRNKRKF